MSGRSSYHHGDLKAALLRAAIEQARQGGPAAIGLRSAQRSLGVSPTAAYKHYPDRDALVVAVEEHAYGELTRHLQEAVDAPRWAGTSHEAARARFRASGEAYVRFALAEPGLFRTLFARRVATMATPDTRPEDAPGPLGVLAQTIDAVHAAGGLRDRQYPWIDITAWAGVHGLATLLLDGPLKDLPADGREIALARLLDVVDAGLH